MDSRREKYKDKVLSHIIGKTKLISTEDESKILIEAPFVALQIPYLISHLSSHPTMTPFPRWAFIGGFKKYCELFGLSKGELTDLFQSYNDALRDIIKNKYYDKGYINESMDKQRQYLYKVADRLVNETDIDLDNNRIHYPYGGLSTTCDGVVVDNPFIVSHLKNVYALDKKEIGEVVSMYTHFIKRKLKLVLKDGRINENVDKQKEYLEYVYNDLIKNTKFRNASYRDIDLYDGKCKSLQVGIRWGSEAPYFNYVPDCLENYLKDYWGLTYNEIQELFWDKYEQHIINMVLSKKENVSPHVRVHVDYLRESKYLNNQTFLNKIVDTMIEETIPYNETKGSVITPFLADKNNNGRWIMSADYCKRVVDDFDYEFSLSKIITDYLEIFALSYEEMDTVMYRYFKEIFEKYFKRFFDLSYKTKPRLDEGIDLAYIEKVTDRVLKEIVWDFDRGIVYFPMINYSAGIRDDDFLSAVNADDAFTKDISSPNTNWHVDLMDHIEDTYAISGNEYNIVWGSLQGEIWEKTNEYWDSFTSGY